jgi:osmotically-inducible protein OsmY
MKNRSWITALVAGGLALTAANLTAQAADDTVPKPDQRQVTHENQPPKVTQPYTTTALPVGENMKASTLIGMHIRNDAGDKLGKLQDIIVNLESHSAPFAIVEYGGALGIGVTHIAVPLSSFKYTSEPKQLILSATKEEFQAASATPTGGWMIASGEEWAKNVDKYYGQPASMDRSRFERQEATDVFKGREAVRNPTEVRNPAEKSASELLNPTPGTVPEQQNLNRSTDEDLTSRVTGLVRTDAGQDADNIQVSIKDGVVTLNGKASASQKQSLESKIRGLPGVTRVENNLTTSKD